MYDKGNKLTKNLSNPLTLQVLQIIGSSEEPLSSTEIHNRWIKKFSIYRKIPGTQHSYIYEVIKNLYKPGHLQHAERYVSITYKDKIAEKITLLRNKYDLKNLEVNEVRTRTLTIDEGFERTKADLAIPGMANNPRNWKYLLNLKGLLLFLRSARSNSREVVEENKQQLKLAKINRIKNEQNELNNQLREIDRLHKNPRNLTPDQYFVKHNKIQDRKSELHQMNLLMNQKKREKRKNERNRFEKNLFNSRSTDMVIRNTMLKNKKFHQKGTSNIVNLEFLEYFDVFTELYGLNVRNSILIDIALELENLLPRVTSEFLKDYIIQRCYEEIKSDIALRNHPLSILSKTQKDANANDTLEKYRLKVLKSLIPIQNAKMEEMKRDLETNYDKL